jgi:TfoX/Sxy family transcriptional regulator of competence genes
MKWVKSPPELAEKFARVLPPDPAVEPRKMFGYPAGFVRGNFFAGLWQDTVVLRLAPATMPDALRAGFGDFEAMPGRIMKNWVRATPAIIADEKKLGTWVARAFHDQLAAPAKVAKPKKKKAAAGAKSPRGKVARSR